MLFCSFRGFQCVNFFISNFLRLYFRFLCQSFCFLMVNLMLSWVVAHDFFALCDKFLVWCCFDFLFGISCWFKMIFLPKVLLDPHDDLDQTLSHDDTFIWFFFALFLSLYFVWLKFYVLVARSVRKFCFCLQKLLVFITSMFYFEMALFCKCILWWN